MHERGARAPHFHARSAQRPYVEGRRERSHGCRSYGIRPPRSSEHRSRRRHPRRPGLSLPVGTPAHSGPRARAMGPRAARRRRLFPREGSDRSHTLSHSSLFIKPFFIPKLSANSSSRVRVGPSSSPAVALDRGARQGDPAFPMATRPPRRPCREASPPRRSPTSPRGAHCAAHTNSAWAAVLAEATT